MLLQSKLETARLLLRPLAQKDAASIQAAASIREVADTTIHIPHPYPEGEAERYIQRQIADLEVGSSVTFAIARKSDGKFSGIIEIRNIDRENERAELSFWLPVEMWGQGLMAEALEPIIAYGFENLELNRLYAHHMVRNPASGKVLQKSGFVQEGVLRQRVRKGGVFEDVKLWAILRADWRGD